MASSAKIALYIAILAVVIYFIKQYANGGVCYSNARLDDKTVIVTGANTGIGKETALDFVKRGGRVILACRSLARATQAAEDIKNITGADDNKIVVMKLDLSSFKAIRDFVKEFKTKEKRLDILVNNAGVVSTSYEQTEDGYEMTWAVNHLGHFLLTHLLMDSLVKSTPSRVVTVSAKAAEVMGINWDDLNYENTEFGSISTYTQTKNANILFSRELGKRLKGSGVTTYSLHPGVIATEILRGFSLYHYPVIGEILRLLHWPVIKTGWHGAQTTVCCAVDESLATATGKYYSDCAEHYPSPHADNDDDAKKLWDISVQMTKLKDSEIHPLLKITR